MGKLSPLSRETHHADFHCRMTVKLVAKNTTKTFVPEPVKVIRATLTAHEPEKPKIKKQKGKAQGVLGQISPWWDSTFRAVTLSPPCWGGGCDWDWQSRNPP